MLCWSSSHIIFIPLSPMSLLLTLNSFKVTLPITYGHIIFLHCIVQILTGENCKKFNGKMLTDVHWEFFDDWLLPKWKRRIGIDSCNQSKEQGIAITWLVWLIVDILTKQKMVVIPEDLFLQQIAGMVFSWGSAYRLKMLSIIWFTRCL